MNVFVVFEEDNFEGTKEIAEIFSTEEKAQNYIDSQERQKLAVLDMYFEEWEVR